MAATSQTTRARSRTEAPRSLVSAQETIEKRGSALRERFEKAEVQTHQLSDIASRMKEAMAAGNIDQVQILNADFASARASLAANTKDLQAAMIGLTEGIQGIGLVLEEAKKYSSEEQQVVDAANQLVERMQGRVTAASTALATAEQMSGITSWFGARRRAIEAAQTDLTRARTELDAAKANVGSAQQMADQMKRARLENMSLEQSMQQLHSIGAQIVSIARDRISEITSNLEMITAGREETIVQLQQWARDVEDGDREIARVKAELESLRQQLEEVQENSSEWMTLKGQIEAKNAELGEVEGKRNNAFSLSQDGQRFLEMYKLQEESQRSLLQFQQTWIALLEEGLRQRSALYQSHLGVIKGAGDQEAMSLQDAVSVRTDEVVQQSAAEHVIALRKNILDRARAMPEQVRRLREITNADAQSKASYEEELDKLFEQFRNNYGTEPRYDDPDAQKPAA